MHFKLFFVYLRFFVSEPIRCLEGIVPREGDYIIVIKMLQPQNVSKIDPKGRVEDKGDEKHVETVFDPISIVVFTHVMIAEASSGSFVP